jgi:hypothetical protein
MKPRRTCKAHAEPNLPTLEPRIPSALKNRNTAKQEDRAKRRKMAAIITPLLAALQDRTGREQ